VSLTLNRLGEREAAGIIARLVGNKALPTGGAAALTCLRQNVASLSQPCQQALNAVGGAAQ